MFTLTLPDNRSKKIIGSDLFDEIFAEKSELLCEIFYYLKSNCNNVP